MVLTFLFLLTLTHPYLYSHVWHVFPLISLVIHCFPFFLLRQSCMKFCIAFSLCYDNLYAACTPHEKNLYPKYISDLIRIAGLKNYVSVSADPSSLGTICQLLYQDASGGSIRERVRSIIRKKNICFPICPIFIPPFFNVLLIWIKLNLDVPAWWLWKLTALKVNILLQGGFSLIHSALIQIPQVMLSQNGAWPWGKLEAWGLERTVM